MAQKDDTWMPWYVGEYLADTMFLNTEMNGAYCLLLMACWKGDGRLPDDDSQLMAITRLPLKTWKQSRATLLEFFDLSDGYYTHKRVIAERIKAKELVRKKSEGGKKGAMKRWPNMGQPIGLPLGLPSGNEWESECQNDGLLYAPQQLHKDIERGTLTIPPVPHPVDKSNGHPVKLPGGWWKSLKGIETAGKLLGLTAHPGESQDNFKARIEAKINAH